MTDLFYLDDAAIPFAAGQTVLQAALAAQHYIPHLCFHPEFRPHGSCKLCTVSVGGRHASACTLSASTGLRVTSHSADLLDLRRTLVQMLLVEGNHFCPSCEKSGACLLQALAIALDVTTPRFEHFYPARPVDFSHPDVLLDFNRCILCELCVHASAEVDGKQVFALSGRGSSKHLVVNAESGKLGDTNFALTDQAAQVCPVGVILPKRRGFAQPLGERPFDRAPLPAQVDAAEE